MIYKSIVTGFGIVFSMLGTVLGVLLLVVRPSDLWVLDPIKIGFILVAVGIAAFAGIVDLWVKLDKSKAAVRTAEYVIRRNHTRLARVLYPGAGQVIVLDPLARLYLHEAQAESTKYINKDVV